MMEKLVGPEEIREIGALRRAVFAYVLSRVKDRFHAEDITQETLLRIHSKIQALRDTDKLQAWIFQIVRNAIADHYRKSEANVEFDENAPGTPDDSLPKAQAEQIPHHLAAYLRSVVEELPEKYRAALVLTDYDGMSQVAMAAHLGISVSAAKSRVQRARAMVKATIERCCLWETDRYGAVLDVRKRAASDCACEKKSKKSASI